MNKPVIFTAAFFVMGSIAWIVLSPVDESQVKQPQMTNSTIKNVTDKVQRVVLDETSQQKNDEVITSENHSHSEQTLSAMTETQKEKYSNLSDSDRGEMLELVSAENEANDAVSEGARKYFELVKEDKNLEKLDAEIEEKIAYLNSLPGVNENKLVEPNSSSAPNK